MCAACAPELRQIAQPMCACCGAPFPFPMEVELCAACAAEHPPYAMARAVWVYNAVSKGMVSGLKFHDRSTELGRYGARMAQAAGEMLQGVEVVVPIPLHWRRLMERRYNQAAWLSFALAAHTGLHVDVKSLKRVRYTTPQVRLSSAERVRNMKGAFAVQGDGLQGKVVLLVDDVITTGATIHEAARCVMGEGGAREVRVLTLAKTLKE